MHAEASQNSGSNVHGKANAGQMGPHIGPIVGAFPAGRTGRSAPAPKPLAISKLLAGPRYIAIYLLTLPVVAVAFASSGWEQVVSGLIAVTLLVLAPAALYARWAAMALPIASALCLALGVLMLPFNSAAFVVDVVATAVMFLFSFPGHGRRPATAEIARV